MNTQSNANTASSVASWTAMIKECEAAGAVKERARISAIMHCEEAIFRGSDALKIALNSDMTLAQARAALAADPGAQLEVTKLRVSAAATVAALIAPRQERAV